MDMKDNFVGVKIFGFCNGYFGRDSYDDKMIIANGENWIVTKNDREQTEFASFDDTNEMKQMIGRWQTEDKH